MLSEALLDRDKPRTDRSEGEGWREMKTGSTKRRVKETRSKVWRRFEDGLRGVGHTRL